MKSGRGAPVTSGHMSSSIMVEAEGESLVARDETDELPTGEPLRCSSYGGVNLVTIRDTK